MRHNPITGTPRSEDKSMIESPPSDGVGLIAKAVCRDHRVEHQLVRNGTVEV